jgi:host factor-I protein
MKEKRAPARAADKKGTGKEGAMSNNLQDNFLNQLRKDKTPVVVYLANGVRLKGMIKGFDSFVIVLKESTQQLIYKHAVSTIVPEREVDLRFEES